MKLRIDDQDVYEITEHKKKVIQYQIPSAIFEADMVRRCKYWVECPCDKHVHLRKQEIRSALKGKRDSIPVDNLKLGAVYADVVAPKEIIEDLKEAKKCKLGEHEFEVCLEARKLWRKMLNEKNPEASVEDVKAAEIEIIKQRSAWILEHKYERSLEKMRFEWEPKLKARGIEEIPLDDVAFADLVFSQDDYQDRDQRIESEKERVA